MLRFSILFREALAKLTLPVLIAAALGLVLLGKADIRLAAQARIALSDALVPLFGLAAGPLAAVHGAIDEARSLLGVRAENARLRQENETLRRWYAVALALDAENTKLKANLNWLPDPAPRFVTAPVVADAGGVYARAVLLAAGSDRGIAKGQVAIDEQGLAGRVTDVGARSARVLLLTDINSRIPVILGRSRARAMLFGANGARPKLLYWPEGAPPVEGEQVVTSGEAGAFPAGLPIGTVRYGAGQAAEVEPAARLARLEMLRILDYAPQIPPPPESSDRQAPGRQDPGRQAPNRQTIVERRP